MILEGVTEGGAVVPVQVTQTGRLVAEGLEGPAGPAGPAGPEGPQGPAGAFDEIGNYAVYGSVQFNGATTKPLIYDANGRLLVGTSSSRGNTFNSTGNDCNFQLEGTAFGGSSASFIRNSNNSSQPYLVLGKTRGTAVGGTTIVNASDSLGTISFQGSDGTELVEAASITAAVDGTPGANDMPGALVFSTTADLASSPTGRMRITSDGKILFGTTGVPDGTSVYGSAFTPQTNGRLTLFCATSSAASQKHAIFYNPNGEVGSISTSASTTAYTTSSDYRLKENVAPVTDGITRLRQLKPSRFNFIADPAKTVDGFIAHEVQAVVPEAITGEKDAVDDDGNPVYQGIDQSKLVPLLTAALQEAVAKIESLEARVTAAGI